MGKECLIKTPCLQGCCFQSLSQSMHPDLKVGLALAMLIVGFAGAMCFRHRPVDVAAQQSDFDRATDLDDELELLPVRTYLPERTPADDTDVEPAAVADNAAERNGTISPEEHIVLDPIGAGVGEGGGTPHVVEASQSNETVPESDSLPATYTVRSGDTLSGIAAQMLGSTQRYHEIFEANRDQLNSPDDLRPGMELVIPPRVRVVPPEPVGDTESVDTPEPESNPTPVTARRFTPIIPR